MKCICGYWASMELLPGTDDIKRWYCRGCDRFIDPSIKTSDFGVEDITKMPAAKPGQGQKI